MRAVCFGACDIHRGVRLLVAVSRFMETTREDTTGKTTTTSMKRPFQNVIGIFLSFFILSFVILSTSFCFQLCERCLPLL